MTLNKPLSLCCFLASLSLGACEPSGPIEATVMRFDPFSHVSFDDATVNLEYVVQGEDRFTLPPKLRLSMFRVPGRTQISVLGYESPRSPPLGLMERLDGRGREHGEPFDASALFAGMHPKDGAGWNYGVGGAPPAVYCDFSYTIDVEGRGSATVDDTAYCGSFFVALVQRYLDEGTWLDVEPSEGAKGYLVLRRYYAQRHEAEEARQAKQEFWTTEGDADSIQSVRYLAVAEETEVEPKKCSGYVDAGRNRTGLVINRTSTEITLYEVGKKEPVASTKVPSIPAGCPKDAFRGDFFIEKADLEAERAWVRETLAKL